MVYICSSTGVDFGFQSLLEGQCLTYLSHSYTMGIWWSGCLPPEIVLKLSCLKRLKMPLHEIGEMERVKYEGQFFPSLGFPEYRSAQSELLALLRAVSACYVCLFQPCATLWAESSGRRNFCESQE